MLVLKIVLLLIAIGIGAYVGTRNIRRDFEPPVRAHLELFLTGVPVGFLFTMLPLPLQAETLGLAAIAGLLTGVVLSYSLPRQWRSSHPTRKEHLR